MTDFQVLDPVIVRQAQEKLEGVVAVVDKLNNRIGVRLTGSSVGKGTLSNTKLGDLQCPPNGGIYVDLQSIRKRPVTRLDELRLRRELGIMSSSTTTTIGATSVRGTTAARSRIRRRQDANVAAATSTSQREASSSTSARSMSSLADPPESFQSAKGQSSSDAKDLASLAELQKEIAELPQQVKSTKERLERIKQQKEQRFQQQQQQQSPKQKEEEEAMQWLEQQQKEEEEEYESMEQQLEQQPEEPPEVHASPPDPVEVGQSPPRPAIAMSPPSDPAKAVEQPPQEEDHNPIVETPPVRRSDPPGRSSDAAVALQRLRAWSQANEPDTFTNNDAPPSSNAPSPAEPTAQALHEIAEVSNEVSAETEETQANSSEVDTSTEDFMIGQTSPQARVEAITDIMSPLEQEEAKNNPDLASRMNVSNCSSIGPSSIGQEVSEVSFFLQSNAQTLHQGLNGDDKPSVHLSTQMEASHSSAERSDEKSTPHNTTQQSSSSSEGMEQVLDPWDRILLQQKGMMELDKPAVILGQAAPEPIAIVDPWANPNTSSASATLNVSSNPFDTSVHNQSTNSTSVLDVSNPYSAMAPVPIPIPAPPPTPERPSKSDSTQSVAPTPLRSNTRATNAGTAGKGAMGESSHQKTAETTPQEREIGERSESMGEVMKYILSQQEKNASEEASQKSANSFHSQNKPAAAEEASQKSTTSFNSLDKKPQNNPYAKAASKSLPVHTTESTFSDLKTNQSNEENVAQNSNNMGVMMSYILNPQQPAPPRVEDDFQKSATSFTSMDNRSANLSYAKAAAAASPAHSTETTFADLLRKAEKRNARKSPQQPTSIQPKPSFEDSVATGMVSVGLESTRSANIVQFDEKKEEESQASSKDSSSKETPFSELKPLSINSKRQSFGGSKPWSKVLNRLTDEVPEPDFRRTQSAPVAVSPARAGVTSKSEPKRSSTGMTSIGTFSENSPDRSIDSYSTSSLPKPPGLRSPFEEDPDLFPLDEGGVSLGRSPIKGLEFNALMPFMNALNDDSMRPSFGTSAAAVAIPDFDENSLMDNSVSSNAAVRTPKRLPTMQKPPSPFGNGTYITPPRPTVPIPSKPPSTILESPDSKLETSSISNSVMTPPPPRRTNAFGSPIKTPMETPVRSPMEESVFAKGAVSTPTRLPTKNERASNSSQSVFRSKSDQENAKPQKINRSPAMLDSSDETQSLLDATANSLYSQNNAADEKDAESFSSYAWTAQHSLAESKSGDNDVCLTGTFDVESQASTPSKIPRITLDDSFSLYSHIEEPAEKDKSPAFLQLDMTGQIKEIMKNTRAKREQTKNEPKSKIVSISPLKSPNDEYDSDKQSFVSSSSDESESLKESAVDDEFSPEEESKKTTGPSRKNMVRCLAILTAMIIGASAAVLYGIGVLDLEIGDSPRASPGGQDTSSPQEPELLSLAERLGIAEFDMVLAHVQASLDWMVQNDSEQFLNSLEPWELDERFALTALYMATTTSEGVDIQSVWKDQRGFLAQDISVCRWNLGGHGAFCDDRGRVVELLLDENEMSGVLPKELGRLRMLEALSLSTNRISGSIPASIFELPNLYSLVLSNNQLTGDIPESRNEALQILNLSENYKLTGEIPESLTNQKSLKHLALLGTNMFGTIPEFTADSELEFVAIADSRIGGTIPSSLTTLPNLRFLYLLENALSGTVPTEYNSENIFKSGNVLEHLYLSGNQLNGSIPSKLKELTRLQHLGFDFNELTGTLPDELGNLDSLQYLYLNSNVNLNADLSNFELQPLLARLKELQIQNTATLLTEDALCFAGDTPFQWDFLASDCEPPTNRVICSCCNVCCPNTSNVDSNNVCLSFQPSGKNILENTVW